MAPPAPPPKPHWAYTGDEGPEHRGDLSPDFGKCKAGHEQTPIDLAKDAPRGAALAPLAFSYAKSPLVLLDNGHTVQANAAPGSTLTANGARYGFVQFHLHAPSEHTVAGKRFDAELHLVHKSDDGKLAVVGVLLAVGKESRALAPFFDHLPSTPSTASRSPSRSTA